jgi:acetyl esterase
MALDPVLKALLNQVPAVPAGPIDYPAMRQMADALTPMFIGPGGLVQVQSIEEKSTPGPAGPVALRVYRPLSPVQGTLHFIHGGGWTLGNLDVLDPSARRLCDALSMVVVTSAYRLAPEHPFPAGLEDGLAAARWVLQNASELGGPGLPVAIGGDSAGGNLSAAICIALRDSGDTQTFDAQLLLYPAVDLRPAAREYASRIADADPTLKSASLPVLLEAYCPDQDPGDWRISPLAASDLSNLPAALVVVQTVDPLHDEGVKYAERLREEGGDVEVLTFDNLTHGFVHFSGLVPAAAEATAIVAQRFQSMLIPNAAQTSLVQS